MSLINNMTRVLLLFWAIITLSSFATADVLAIEKCAANRFVSEMGLDRLFENKGGTLHLIEQASFGDTTVRVCSWVPLVSSEYRGCARDVSVRYNDMVKVMPDSRSSEFERIWNAYLKSPFPDFMQYKWDGVKFEVMSIGASPRFLPKSYGTTVGENFQWFRNLFNDYLAVSERFCELSKLRDADFAIAVRNF